MPISTSDEYSRFFLGTKSSVARIECMEFSHSSFSTIYLVRNVSAGITISGRTYSYYPLKIENSTTSDDMDFSMSVTFGDLGEVMPTFLDQIADAGKMDEKPLAKYKAFRSDTLDSILDEITMEIVNVSFNKTGCVLQCSAPSINKSKVGELYTIDRFPMLAGFT